MIYPKEGEEKRKTETTDGTSRKQTARLQTRTQSNRIKCKWRKYSSEKVETVRLDKKVRPNYTAYKKHSLNVNANSLKGWKKIYCANISQRKVGLAVLISK